MMSLKLENNVKIRQIGVWKISSADKLKKCANGVASGSENITSDHW